MISIFIPVYNGDHYIAKTLDSVLAQTYADWEALCVDDSSTDGSYALLQKYASSDPRIRLFQKPNGGSVPPSWEFIIPHIKGDYVLYMSQDDLLEPDTLEKLIKRQQETGADAVLPHEIHYLSSLPDSKQHHLCGINGDITPIITGREAFRLMIDYSISGRALWPIHIVRNIGMPSDTYNADELAQRLWALNCEMVAFSDAIFIYNRENPNAITHGISAKTYDDTLTNALLYNTAKKAFPLDSGWLSSMANTYFKHLYLRMIQYLQHRRQYTHKDRKTIRMRFCNAYRILHKETKPSSRLQRIAAINFPLMQSTVRYKQLQFLCQHVTINQELDCYSYQKHE